MIEIIDTGILYSNPVPHLKSIHAYFPSVAQMQNGNLIAVFSLGEAFEAINLHTHYGFSSDNGKTWQRVRRLPVRVKNKLTSDASRITITPDGQLAILVCVYDRTLHKNEGLTNPETLGFVPTRFFIIRSYNMGKTFSKPQPLNTPITGPCFELCSPIVITSNGTWIVPTSTWKAWNGVCPFGMKAVALISHNQGRSWQNYSIVMDAYEKQVVFWESKIMEMPDKRLIAVAWAQDLKNNKTLPNHFSISRDNGKIWSKPQSTQIYGQTLTPIPLSDGKILSVYRRMDKPGLWANISMIEKDKWLNIYEMPLWGNNLKNLTANTKNPSTDFHFLKFGAPSMIRLKNGLLFLAFWCYENCISIIRWFTIKET
ncbi:MAG: glycoside hydrolase [Candidatus Omnitrophica bacterium]|nr:glycoside hydrolase [Candidatus Omnitrophota bacterium]